MLIRVKVGKVEIEYSEPTNSTDYPKCTSGDKFQNEGRCKSDALLITIKEIADKAAEIYHAMEI